MPRKLTKKQEAVLGYVMDKGDATIKEVAADLDMPYPTAQQALSRLYYLGGIEKHRLGDGTNKLVYRKVDGPDPDSKDPLEQAFAAPSFEREKK